MGWPRGSGIPYSRQPRDERSTFCAWTRLRANLSLTPQEPTWTVFPSAASFLTSTATRCCSTCPSGSAKMGATHVHAGTDASPLEPAAGLCSFKPGQSPSASHRGPRRSPSPGPSEVAGVLAVSRGTSGKDAQFPAWPRAQPRSDGLRERLWGSGAALTSSGPDAPRDGGRGCPGAREDSDPHPPRMAARFFLGPTTQLPSPLLES